MCIQCDVLWSLMRSFSAGSDFMSVLSPRIQRSLMGSLIMSAMGERKKEFLTHVRMYVHHRFPPCASTRAGVCIQCDVL